MPRVLLRIGLLRLILLRCAGGILRILSEVVGIVCEIRVNIGLLESNYDKTYEAEPEAPCKAMVHVVGITLVPDDLSSEKSQCNANAYLKDQRAYQ